MSPEIRKRPIGFRHLGSSPFCEGESQTLKLPLTAQFTQQTSVFGFVCSTKQKGLGTNLDEDGVCNAITRSYSAKIPHRILYVDVRLVNHTGVSLRFTTQRSLNKSCDIPILEAAVRQVTPSL